MAKSFISYALPTDRLPGFTTAGGVGFVLLPIGQLRMFARYNATLISGYVIDRKSFVDTRNPEASAGEAGAREPMFSLRAEGNNVRPKDEPLLAPKDVRMPSLLGLACRKAWWDASA